MSASPPTEEQYSRALGIVLKVLRREQHLSQEEAAAEAGFDRSHLSGIETAVHDPRSYKLLRLARAYHITLGELGERIEEQLRVLFGKRK